VTTGPIGTMSNIALVKTVALPEKFDFFRMKSFPSFFHTPSPSPLSQWSGTESSVDWILGITTGNFFIISKKFSGCDTPGSSPVGIPPQTIEKGKVGKVCGRMKGKTLAFDEMWDTPLFIVHSRLHHCSHSH